MAVFPSPDSETALPCWAPRQQSTPVPTSLLPCCDQTPPLRVNTHAAPIFGAVAVARSSGAPTMAVFPSDDSATDVPCKVSAGKGSLHGEQPSVPTSLLPCCVQTPPLRVKTQATPTLLLS